MPRPTPSARPTPPGGLLRPRRIGLFDSYLLHLSRRGDQLRRRSAHARAPRHCIPMVANVPSRRRCPPEYGARTHRPEPLLPPAVSGVEARSFIGSAQDRFRDAGRATGGSASPHRWGEAIGAAEPLPLPTNERAEVLGRPNDRLGLVVFPS